MSQSHERHIIPMQNCKSEQDLFESRPRFDWKVHEPERIFWWGCSESLGWNETQNQLSFVGFMSF